jgi:hypothetical protein
MSIYKCKIPDKPIISVLKELICSITGLIKMEKPSDNSGFVDSLEKLLQLCQELGQQIDEIGVCLYPPQGEFDGSV